jgi:hypothetical protein
LVERNAGSVEVRSSTLLGSTNRYSTGFTPKWGHVIIGPKSSIFLSKSLTIPYKYHMLEVIIFNGFLYTACIMLVILVGVGIAKKKFIRWSWYLCTVPIFIGTVLILISLLGRQFGIFLDMVDEHGILHEHWWSVYALGILLVIVGLAGVSVVFITKGIRRYYQYLKHRF